MARLRTAGVVLHADREGDRVRLTPDDPFDLARAITAAHKIANAVKVLMASAPFAGP